MPSRHQGRHANEIRYWAFLADPRLYRIEDAVRELEGDSWATKGSAVAVGDRVLIWKAKGNEPVRGIVALGEVLTDPAPLRGDSEYWVDPSAGRAIEDHVHFRYVRPPGLLLWLDGPQDAILRNLNVSRARGGTVFHVTPEQWASVVEAAGGWPQEAPEVEDVRAVIKDLGRSQGFQSSPEVRRVVELHAMERARAHLEALGWRVEDVSARKSYDLHCTRLDEEDLRVEVKGATGDGSAVLLTPNEVEHARVYHPQVALVVVSDIDVTGTGSPNPVAHAGTLRVWNPWALGEGHLTAMGYRYKPPTAE